MANALSGWVVLEACRCSVVARPSTIDITQEILRSSNISGKLKPEKTCPNLARPERLHPHRGLAKSAFLHLQLARAASGRPLIHLGILPFAERCDDRHAVQPALKAFFDASSRPASPRRSPHRGGDPYQSPAEHASRRA